MQSQVKGFTLIEVLVVMLIFSIMLSFIAFATGVFSSDKMDMERRALTLYNQMLILQQKALLDQSVYRLALYSSQQYEVQRYDIEDRQWITLLSPRTLKPQILANAIHLNFDIDNVTQSSEILFHPSGEMTAFTIMVQSDAYTQKISGVQQGLIQLHEVKKIEKI